MYYITILDRVITALDCNWGHGWVFTYHSFMWTYACLSFLAGIDNHYEKALRSCFMMNILSCVKISIDNKKRLGFFVSSCHGNVLFLKPALIVFFFSSKYTVLNFRRKIWMINCVIVPSNVDNWLVACYAWFSYLKAYCISHTVKPLA